MLGSIERKLELNIKNILCYTSKKDIMEAFFGTNKIYGSFSSPLRKDDHPSFSISKRNFRFKDHVSNETGDCFDLISKYYSISILEALVVAVDLVGIRGKFTIPNTNYVKQVKPEIRGFVKGHDYTTLDLNVTTREWEDYDLEYWGKYGITNNILKLGNILPISHYYLNELMYVADKHSYAFFEKKDGKVTIKVYQPFRDFGKWVNNNSFDVWELFFLLPDKGKYLIINSSRKDALAVIASIRIPSVSFQAEGILPKKHVLKSVVDRFDYVFVLYDNDKKSTNWGQENASKLIAMDKRLINIVIPDKYKSKDFSDLIVETSEAEAKEVLLSLMKDGIKNHTI